MDNVSKSIVYPFSKNFLTAWGLWKDYMLESHEFKYRGLISEQMALKRIVDLSEGEEEKAVRIIHQSISREWKDFFELRQPSPNGKSKTRKQPTARDNEQIRTDVQAELNKRFREGGQEGGESHLKAV